MNKIPTAEEFLESKNSVKRFEGVGLDDLIEFAKMHVENALKIASKKAMISQDLYDFIEDSWESGDKIDKESILNAYPLTNIK